MTSESDLLHHRVALRPILGLVLASLAGLTVLSSTPATTPPATMHMADACTLVAAPGDAFSFVAPPISHAQSDGRFALATPVNVTYIGFGAFPAAQAAFQAAVDIWANLVSSPVPINVRAEFKVLSPGVLGSAGATYTRDFLPPTPPIIIPGTWYPYPLSDRLRGFDGAPGSFDIQASFNSSFSWYFGTDGATPGGQFDFVSVVLHELGHGFGFAGAASVSGGIGSMGWSGYPTIYDRYTVTENFTPLLALPNPSATLGTLFTTPYNAGNPRGPGAYWGGPAGMAGNGGLTARLYTAAAWSGGSSYSHLDDSTFPAGNPNSLMTHSISSAEAIHNPGPITLGLFSDMGWTISPSIVANDRDFNSDGKTDLLFANTSGDHYVWFMDGTTLTGGGFLSPNPIDTNLQIVGVNDLTGDGQADLLLQHQINGTVTLHKMNGLTKVGEQTIQSTTNTGWTVVGTADLNNDTHPDIVWQNFATGQVYVWFMASSGGNATYAGAGGAFSGDFIRSAGSTILAASPTTLRVMGLGDMSSDGRPDLVWHDSSTGLLRVWTLNGTTRTSDVAMSPGSVAAAWKLRTVGDYNADLKADIIWQHTTTGDLYAWFMNGTSFASGTYLSPSRVNPVWTLMGPK